MCRVAQAGAGNAGCDQGERVSLERKEKSLVCKTDSRPVNICGNPRRSKGRKARRH